MLFLPVAYAEPESDLAIEGASERDEQRKLDAIVITGVKPRGSVIGDIQPDIVYDQEAIEALGATTIGEILEELAPQTSSGRGRGSGGGAPVVLVNGVRISSFREIRSFPSEAVSRVDILPEEVALKYGYKADQRVINFVLVEKFDGYTTEGEVQFPTAGAGNIYEVEGGYLRIRDKGRWNLNAEYEVESSILESDRDLTEGASEYSLAGNIVPVDGLSEIDTSLSALVGDLVSIAAVPGSAANTSPSLENFVPGANAPNFTSQQPHKTLQGENRSLSVTGSYNQLLREDLQGTFTVGFDLEDGERLLGLPELDILIPAENAFSPFSEDVTLLRLVDDFGPIVRQTDSASGTLGLSLIHMRDGWNWTFTSNLTHTESDTETDGSLITDNLNAAIQVGDNAVNPFGELASYLVQTKDSSASSTTNGDAELLANGVLLNLPTGEVATSFSAGFDFTDRQSSSVRAGIEERSDLSREISSAQANIDIPLISEDMNIPFIDTFSVNMNAGIEDYSDFGFLQSFGYGFQWVPLEKLEFQVSYTNEEGAPTISQLGDPVISTPNQRVFDYVTGETVLATRVDGGNPNLLADERSVWSVGVKFDPFEDVDFTLNGDYVESEIESPSASFPNPTVEIEAAFPERFVRNGEGDLIAFDDRPINLDSEYRREFRWGLMYSRSLAKESENPRTRATQQGRAPRSPSGEARRQPNNGASGAPPARAARSGELPRGGSRSGPPGPPRGGRMFVSLNHVWLLEDRLFISDQFAPLDFLNGSATGSRGGKPEHEINLRTGMFKNGVGARMDVDWQSGTYVDTGGGSSLETLDFSDLLTVELRVFYNFSASHSWSKKAPLLKNSRIEIELENIFDEKLTVTDASGLTPLSYQPDELDPLGRTIKIEFRKQFR